MFITRNLTLIPLPFTHNVLSSIILMSRFRTSLFLVVENLSTTFLTAPATCSVVCSADIYCIFVTLSWLGTLTYWYYTLFFVSFKCFLMYIMYQFVCSLWCITWLLYFILIFNVTLYPRHTKSNQSYLTCFYFWAFLLHEVKQLILMMQLFSFPFNLSVQLICPHGEIGCKFSWVRIRVEYYS